jgi:hypothetical protein
MEPPIPLAVKRGPKSAGGARTDICILKYIRYIKRAVIGFSFSF